MGAKKAAVPNLGPTRNPQLEAAQVSNLEAQTNFILGQQQLFQDEQSFRDLQRGILTQQLQDRQAIQPGLLEQQGVTRDPTTGEFLFAEDPAQDLIEQLEFDFFSQAAGEGTVPLSVQEATRVGREDLNQRLFRQLGTGANVSSPGIEALSTFERDRAIVEDEARRANQARTFNQATTLSQLGLSREAGRLSNIGNIFGLQTSGLPTLSGQTVDAGTLGNLFAQGSQASTGALGVFNDRARIIADINKFNAGQQNERFNSLITGAAGLAGTGAGLGISRSNTLTLAQALGK